MPRIRTWFKCPLNESSISYIRRGRVVCGKEGYPPGLYVFYGFLSTLLVFECNSIWPVRAVCWVAGGRDSGLGNTWKILNF
jgi:hypothetical protein